VSGPRGLQIGDPITSISGCQVRNLEEWNACIGESMRESSLGHCMTTNVISFLDTTPKSKK